MENDLPRLTESNPEGIVMFERGGYRWWRLSSGREVRARAPIGSHAVYQNTPQETLQDLSGRVLTVGDGAMVWRRPGMDAGADDVPFNAAYPDIAASYDRLAQDQDLPPRDKEKLRAWLDRRWDEANASEKLHAGLMINALHERSHARANEGLRMALRRRLEQGIYFAYGRRLAAEPYDDVGGLVDEMQRALDEGEPVQAEVVFRAREGTLRKADVVPRRPSPNSDLHMVIATTDIACGLSIRSNATMGDVHVDRKISDAHEEIRLLDIGGRSVLFAPDGERRRWRITNAGSRPVVVRTSYEDPGYELAPGISQWLEVSYVRRPKGGIVLVNGGERRVRMEAELQRQVREKLAPLAGLPNSEELQKQVREQLLQSLLHDPPFDRSVPLSERCCSKPCKPGTACTDCGRVR